MQVFLSLSTKTCPKIVNQTNFAERIRNNEYAFCALNATQKGRRKI